LNIHAVHDLKLIYSLQSQFFSTLLGWMTFGFLMYQLWHGNIST